MRVTLITAALLAWSSAARADWVQLLSAFDVSTPPSVTAGGDSGLPIVSSDGRYVLFASAARNLVLGGQGQGIPATSPVWLNVYRRDRFAETTVLVSVDRDGLGGGEGDSRPLLLSANGQFALFESDADNLVPDDTNGVSDVFLRDVLTGTTELISVSTNGRSANGGSRTAVMTPYNRYVAFVSEATDLVDGDTNGVADVFVRDRFTGVTMLASLLGSSQFANASDAPEITPDGRYLAFFNPPEASYPPSGEIYVRDLIGETTLHASVNVAGLLPPGDPVSCSPRLSDDGRYVAFTAFEDDIASSTRSGYLLRHDLLLGTTEVVDTNAHVPPADWTALRNLDMTPDGRCLAYLAVTNSTGGTGGEGLCVLRWDALSGQTTLISGDLSDSVASGTVCDAPVISSSGRHVAFVCNATNMTTNTVTGEWHVYLHDVVDDSTELVNVATNGMGLGIAFGTVPDLSGYGDCVAFANPAPGHVPGDRNDSQDVFVRDLWLDQTELVSVRHADLPSTTGSGVSGWGVASVSTNADVVAFSSDADDLVSNDVNGLRDVFVWDKVTGSTILVSVATNGLAGLGMSSEPVLSGDGRYVAFSSTASNLVAGDLNGAMDVFVRDLLSGTTERVSAKYTTNCNSSSDEASAPRISEDGRYVLFTAVGSCYSPPPTLNYIANLYLRDLQEGTNAALTYNGVADASMSPDGRYVAFIGAVYPWSTDWLYVWDTQLPGRVYTNTAFGLSRCVISPDGQRVAYRVEAGGVLHAAEMPAGPNVQISMGVSDASDLNRACFSSDGTLLVYATTASHAGTDTNGTRDVYLYDFTTGTNTLVSRSHLTGDAANGDSDMAALSPDGRFVAYRSTADDIVPGDGNGVSDLFLFDRVNQSAILISVNNPGTTTAIERSSRPVFSADSKTLVFNSWASDLVALDFNRRGDLFLLPLAAPPIMDTDLDGMDDQWELNHFGTIARDGQGDFDADSGNDLFEFLSGTNPINPFSLFRLQMEPTGRPVSGTTLSWPTRPWGAYRVQYKAQLDQPAWQDLPGNVTVFGSMGVAVDESPAEGRRLYRVELGN